MSKVTRTWEEDGRLFAIEIDGQFYSPLLRIGQDEGVEKLSGESFHDYEARLVRVIEQRMRAELGEETDG